MGQKVDPRIIRIGIVKSWPSMWYADRRQYTKLLHQDLELRKAIEKEFSDCGIAEIIIQRHANNVLMDIYSAKPGMMIGREGEKIDVFKDKLKKMFGENININIKEVKKPNLVAKLVGELVARQIEKRISYRRAVKKTLRECMDEGAQGVKIMVSGRLNGVEIARREFSAEGKIPLQTFRADIDYACVPALTKYGIIGVKVWIYKGEIFKKTNAKRSIDQ